MTILQQFQQQKSARDEVFNHVKNLFGGKPQNILEIGCLRDLNSRAGDGWSTLHWADYVERNGGSLLICDINKESVKLCLNILSENFPQADFLGHVADGIGLLWGGGYDFIYLDGGDDPTETLKQFEECLKLQTPLVLIDDFHTKGKLVNEKYPKKFLFNFTNGHRMAIYGVGEGEKIIEV